MIKANTRNINRATVYAGDYVKKDGKLVRVETVTRLDVFTSDGGCIDRNELTADDVLLASEVE